MNARERISAALQHRPTDHVPVYPILSGVTRHLVGASYHDWATDPDIYVSAMEKAARDFDLDCLVTLIDLSVEADAWGIRLIYPESEAAHPDYRACLVQEPEDYRKVEVVDFRHSARMHFHIEACRRLVASIGDERPVVAFVFGPLGVLSMLRGQQDMFMDLIDCPGEVAAAAARVNETLKAYVDALLDTGVAAVMFDTLFASRSIMSKAMWDEIEGPLAEDLAHVCHARGVPVMVHNCGNGIYFDVQIRRMKPAAISFLYPPDDCADLAETKARYGDQVTLIGAVPPTMVLTATDEEWDAICRQQIEVLGRGGGFILATGCEYPANAALGRARRMIEIARESTWQTLPG
ncbi:MAG: uroporphyrinogen decarboxylase family protein [Bacillota bacterium]|nr:uroporphyrinogen decarboxylase family protein [Bacillota bacterium]